MIINCPDCECQFQVTVKPVDHTGRKYVSDSPITPKALRSILQFMRTLGPGRQTSAKVRQAYDELLKQNPDWPSLTDRALFTCLRRNGAKKFRTATYRGWDIPIISDDQEPAKPAPSARAKIEASAYQDALTAHGGGGLIAPRGAERVIDARTTSQTKQSGNDLIARIARERREAAERERQAELADMHDMQIQPPELPPF